MKLNEFSNSAKVKTKENIIEFYQGAADKRKELDNINNSIKNHKIDLENLKNEIKSKELVSKSFNNVVDLQLDQIDEINKYIINLKELVKFF